LAYPNADDCGYTATDSIVLNIANIGIGTVNFATNPANITLNISGISTNTLMATINSGSIGPGGNLQYKISSNYDLSTSGQYYFDGFIICNADGDHRNDTMAQQSIISYPLINSFPFEEDFESGQNFSFKTAHGLESMVNISGIAANNSNFGMHFQGGSFASWTYPTTVEMAYTNTSHLAAATSCQVDATSLQGLNLKLDLRQTCYDNYTQDKNTWFRVILTDNNMNTHYLTDNNGDSVFHPIQVSVDPFKSHVFKLSQFTGQQFSLSFEAVNRYSYNYGANLGDNVMIDNIKLWEPEAIDLAVIKIIEGANHGPVGDSGFVKVLIENQGLDTLSDFALHYLVNQSNLVTDTFFGALAPNETDTFSFSSGFILSAGNSMITAYCNLAADLNTLNDSASLMYKGMRTIYPNYADNFEGSNDWISTGSFNQFELGTPTTTHISASHSGANAWVTRLNSNYIVNAKEYLYTPYFTILPYNDSLVLSFWQMMRTQSNTAFGTLEYSFDGQLWNSIGYIGMPNSQNWYNANILGQHKWNSMDNNWKNSWVKLDPATFNSGARVQFRFVFETLASATTEEGWAIDDFELYFPPISTDAGVTEIILPSDTIEIGTTHPVKVKIKNFGTDTISNFPVVFRSNIGNPTVENFSGSIAPNATTEFTFSATYTAAPNASKLCAYTDLVGDLQFVNDTTCKQMVFTATTLDAGISRIVTPTGQTTIGQAQQVQVYVRNYGLNAIQNVDLLYYIGNALQATETHTGTINPGDSVAHTFATTFVSPVGSYKVSAVSKLIGDGYVGNDSITVFIIGTSINDATNNRFAVEQNQPNPSTDATQVTYFIPKAGVVQYRLFNGLGVELFNAQTMQQMGKHQWTIDTHEYAAGIYYYSILFNGQEINKKMIVK
jgi:hypothetical protein